MWNNFKALSLSYKQAPIEIRELVALDEQQIKTILPRLMEITGVSDLMLLSTCNRTEIYYSGDRDILTDFLHIMKVFKNSKLNCVGLFFQKMKGFDAVRHLFNVSLGLEAQITGDIQIINQVKRAYQISCDEATAGPFLHRLLHTIFAANKRVITETAFRDGAASTSYAATELVKEMMMNIANPNILVLGLGEIGIDVCKNLKKSTIGNISICNRSIEKAYTIAEECGFKVIPYDYAQEGLSQADIVINTMPAGNSLFNLETLELVLNGHIKYFIDLAVPRCITPEMEDIKGLVAYNIDDLNVKTEAVVAMRNQAVPMVEQIITEAIDGLGQWSDEMVASPALRKFKALLDQIRKEEISRHLKDLEPKEAERLDMLSKNMMQKIMKLPVLQLKAACKRGEAAHVIDALSELFDLENSKYASNYKDK